MADWPLFAALNCLALIPSALVYVDARRHRIGRVPGERRLLNMSAGAIASLALWLSAFVIVFYLLDRRELIARSRRYPSHDSGLWIYVVSALSFVFLSSLVGRR